MKLSLSELSNPRNFTAQVLRSALSLSVGVGIYQVLNFIFRYVLIHTWTPSDYGVLTLILTIAGLLVIFTEFNLNATTTIFLARDISNPANRQTLLEILFTFVMLTVFVLVATFGITRFFHGSETWGVFREYYWLIWVMVIFNGLAAISCGVLRAYKKMNYEAITNVVKGLAMLGLVLVAVYVLSSDSISSIMIILIVAQTLSFLAAIILLSKVKRDSTIGVTCYVLANTLKKISFSNIRSILFFSFFMSALSASNALLLSVDKIMIPQLLSTVMLGFYGGANLIAQIPKLITSTVALSLITFVSERSGNIAEAKSHYFKFFGLFLVVAMAGYGLFAYFTPYIVSILLPEDYGQVTSVIRILLIGMFFGDFYSLNATFAASAGKTKTLRRIMIFLGVAVILNIGLNWILIPKYGIEGAAVASAISFSLPAVISTEQIRRLK